jgi:hypothetical protein
MATTPSPRRAFNYMDQPVLLGVFAEKSLMLKQAATMSRKRRTLLRDFFPHTFGVDCQSVCDCSVRLHRQGAAAAAASTRRCDDTLSELLFLALVAAPVRSRDSTCIGAACVQFLWAHALARDRERAINQRGEIFRCNGFSPTTKAL